MAVYVEAYPSPDFNWALRDAAVLPTSIVDRAFGKAAIETARHFFDIDREIMDNLDDDLRRMYERSSHRPDNPKVPPYSWASEVVQFNACIGARLGERFTTATGIELVLTHDSAAFTSTERISEDLSIKTLGKAVALQNRIRLTQGTLTTNTAGETATVDYEDVVPNFSVDDVTSYVKGYVEASVDLLRADPEDLRALVIGNPL